ncbi:MAG: tRNA (guanosine(37)-N1)-methyltransferase TrmD [Candidatus Paceibacterota bacterium]
MHFHIITLFPEMFDSYLNESILGRAIKNKKIKITFVNPRKFVTGKYKKVWPDGNVSLQVDDRPYAGGPGMVMRAEPVLKAVENVTKKILHPTLRCPPYRSSTPFGYFDYKDISKGFTVGSLTQPHLKRGIKPKILIINFIPNAEKFDTKVAKNFAKKYTDIIMICGRYEGIDARVDKILRQAQDKFCKFKKISIGNYVLTGGEIPAMILIDCISRQIEGVLGNFDSREEERVSTSEVYTRPEIIIYNKKKYKVPAVLLSGDHKKIEKWKMR